MDRFSICFKDVEDPRRSNCRHELNEMLMIALGAMLCGGEDCTDMALFGATKKDFLRQFMVLRHGIPSHDSFSHLFRNIDPDGFHAAFQTFMTAFATNLGEVIAIGGNSLRRSFDRAQDLSPLYLVSVYSDML